MAAQTPPTITPVPTPPIQRGDRATFSSRVDAFILWLVAAVAQFQALATNVFTNAGMAVTAADTAIDKADDASDSATAAADSASAANISAGAAAQSATNASNSASAAAANVTGLIATSTTSNTVSTGAKTFTVQANKQFVAGVDIKVVSAANAANVMYGTVTSYSGTSLVINVVSVEGSGTTASWNFSVAGQRGAAGPAGGSGLVFAKGNTGTAQQTVNYLDGEGQTMTATGNFVLSGSNFPAGRLSAVLLKLVDGGAFIMTSTGIVWIKPDRTTTSAFSEVGIALRVSGPNNIALFSYGDGILYGKVV